MIKEFEVDLPTPDPIYSVFFSIFDHSASVCPWMALVGQDKCVGSCLLAAFASGAAYFSFWLLCLPFVDDDSPIQRLFPHRLVSVRRWRVEDSPNLRLFPHGLIVGDWALFSVTQRRWYLWAGAGMLERNFSELGWVLFLYHSILNIDNAISFVRKQIF